MNDREKLAIYAMLASEVAVYEYQLLAETLASFDIGKTGLEDAADIASEIRAIQAFSKVEWDGRASPITQATELAIVICDDIKDGFVMVKPPRVDGAGESIYANEFEFISADDVEESEVFIGREILHTLWVLANR